MIILSAEEMGTMSKNNFLDRDKIKLGLFVRQTLSAFTLSSTVTNRKL